MAKKMDNASYVAFNEAMQPLGRVHDIDEKCMAQLKAQVERILAEAEVRKKELVKPVPPKVEAPKPVPPKVEAPKVEAPKVEAPKITPPKAV